MELTVEVSKPWLRVEVRGGPWLGAVFGSRILQTLDFTEQLCRELAPHFTPRETEGEELPVDSERGKFLVRLLEGKIRSRVGYRRGRP